MTGGPGRYAICFTPETGPPLARFGAQWAEGLGVVIATD